MFYFDSSYMVLMIVSIVLGLATQGYIKAQYGRYSKVPLSTGMSGAEVARRMLDDAGLRDVGIETVGGNLTDHYDPKTRVLRLSEGVYGGRSVAAAGVASHEAGHAVQHARAYLPAAVRGALVPGANIGSQIGPWLVIGGLLLRFSGLITIGIVLFAAAVAFQIVTLPVEFDASRRAIASLRENALIPPEQVAGARGVLTAAALTYVAGALIAVMQLLYFIGLGRRD
jgi:Zn-dependent membrane protease YugP